MNRYTGRCIGNYFKNNFITVIMEKIKFTYYILTFFKANLKLKYVKNVTKICYNISK